MAESICGMQPVEVNRKMHKKRGSGRKMSEIHWETNEIRGKYVIDRESGGVY